MASIEFSAYTLKELRDYYNAAKVLPVTVEAFLHGGEWETSDRELLFTSGGKIPIVKLGKSFITVEADGEEIRVVPLKGGEYLIRLSV